MNYDKIRSMNDKELAAFLKSAANRDTTKCSRCKRTPHYVVKIENLDTHQTKKLLALCPDCYNKFLLENDTVDILWN